MGVRILVWVSLGLFILPVALFNQAAGTLAARGGFSVEYTPKPGGPCVVCSPKSFNGALVLWLDFRAGTVKAAVEGGAETSEIQRNCETGKETWYDGKFLFRGEGSGGLNAASGSFDLEVAAEGEEGGFWSYGCTDCPKSYHPIHRRIRISGQVGPDGKGRGKVFSDDGPCVINGEWQTLNAVQGQAQPAPADTIESIPKDLEHYHYVAPIPALPPEQGFASATGDVFADFYDQRRGELEILFSYASRSGANQELSFKKSMAELIPADTLELRAKTEAGEMILSDKSDRRLTLGYKVLDELEKAARVPDNAATQPAPGESIARGSELEFSWHILLHEGGRVAARSSAANRVKYIVRFPVIFIPGTAGSRLSVDSGGTLAEVWPANAWHGTMSEADRQYWQRLALGPSGASNPVVATDIFRYYGQTWEDMLAGLSALCGRPVRPSAKSVYQGFLDHMAVQGYAEYTSAPDQSGTTVQPNQRLFLFPYDWRLDIEAHMPALDKLVDVALDLYFNRQAQSFGSAVGPAYRRQPGDSVIFIGHSQGGLLMRAYAAEPERAAKVQSFIMLGAPNLGSLNSFKALAGAGYNFEALFLHPEVGKWVGRDWVSPYEMLPFTESGSLANFLFDDKGQPVTDTLQELKAIRSHVFCYARSSIFSGAPGEDSWALNPGHLDRALRFFGNLPNPADKGIPTYLVVGFDQPTIIAFRKATRLIKLDKNAAAVSANKTVSHSALQGLLPPECLALAEYPVTAEDASTCVVAVPFYEEIVAPCGDGTVPLHSSTGLKGATPIYIPGAKHGGLAENPQVQAVIDKLLAGVVPAGAAQPACSSLPNTVGSGILIAARNSPAFLQVFDGQGRHTGVAADGSFEEAIPGSVFDLYGETQQAWLPYTREELRVRLEGVSNTQVDVTIAASDGQNERRVEYRDITETPGMGGEIRFNAADLGDQTTLSIDQNADGVFDAARPPDASSQMKGRPSGTAGGGGGGGGGGGRVTSGSGLGWPLIILVVLILCSLGVVLALVSMRRRQKRSASPKISATLRVHYDDNRVIGFSIREQRLTIGRAADNTLVIEDPYVSAHQAEILVSPKGFLLRAVPGSNLVLVNGRKAMEKYLYRGDVVTVGKTKITLES